MASIETYTRSLISAQNKKRICTRNQAVGIYGEKTPETGDLCGGGSYISPPSATYQPQNAIGQDGIDGPHAHDASSRALPPFLHPTTKAVPTFCLPCWPPRIQSYIGHCWRCLLKRLRRAVDGPFRLRLIVRGSADDDCLAHHEDPCCLAQAETGDCSHSHGTSHSPVTRLDISRIDDGNSNQDSDLHLHLAAICRVSLDHDRLWGRTRSSMHLVGYGASYTS